LWVSASSSPYISRSTNVISVGEERIRARRARASAAGKLFSGFDDAVEERKVDRQIADKLLINNNYYDYQSHPMASDLSDSRTTKRSQPGKQERKSMKGKRRTMFGARAENEKESDNLFEKQNVTEDSIYDFLSNHLCPAVASSLPILLRRIAHDSKNFITNGAVRFYHFLLPKWSREQHDLLPGVRQMWQQKEGELADFMLRHFDVNKDGHISAQELLNMTELLSQFQPAQESWAAWFRREWPLMDWKLGVFLWRSFGGILFLLAMLSIVPGRTHRISAKILRWPILGITYFLVAVELM
jgi:hypothetical protein